MSKDQQTPMMRQYRQIKAALPDNVILFFRLGDFYEMFFEDAKRAAPVLDVALTRRNGVPMCGIPYHAAETYLARLIRKGIKVAICDQVEDPALSKGIVKREVTRVVTPGTVTEEHILDAARHNFLVAITAEKDSYGVAGLDLSTGLFTGEQVRGAAALADCLRRLGAAECVLPADLAETSELRRLINDSGATITPADEWIFGADSANDTLLRHFNVHSLDGFGCRDLPLLVCAAGGMLHYVREDLHHTVGHVRALRVTQAGDYMALDETTCANLDLVPQRGRDGGPSLLKVLDVTRTAMGARLLRDWLLRPLADKNQIEARLDAVEELLADRMRLRDLIEVLGEMRDIERIVMRIACGSGSPRDVAAIRRSLEAVPGLRVIMGDAVAGRLGNVMGGLHEMPELVKRIADTIVDEPPALLKDGGIIREGFNAELDELRAAATSGRQWLAEYQTQQQQVTGIKNIKVRHNKVFGYYIEVSKGQVQNVPEAYIRKQTLVNAERYITPELKEYETKIVGAHERALAMETELFMQVRDAIAAEIDRLQEISRAAAELDVLAALAERALMLDYVRPVIHGGDELRIRDGRHPVVEQMADAERFVPNDTLLNCTTSQLAIITGPNMAGKSTYIRQVALIAIMAHIGSYVPAAEALVPVIDRVFTRVGASDDLARGRSTFMVEMQETANILNNATPRSLIVLDEIGRGTSTFDGISIAWAVAEHLHNEKTVKAKTLFATHYHELTDLARTMDGIVNCNVQVREKDDTIIFLRKIVAGGADKSYGIQVARLAGMPDPVVRRAKEILANLEEGEFSEEGQPKLARRRSRPAAAPPLDQLTLF